MKKAVIRILLICMALNMIPPVVFAEKTGAINVTEFLNADFDNKTENSSAHGTYWYDRMQIQNWVDNDPKYIKDPKGESEGLCLSSTMLKSTNRYFSAWVAPIGNTKENIKAEDVVYISVDLYLPKEFSGKLDLRIDSAANSTSIGKVVFEENSIVWNYSGSSKRVVGAPETDKWYRIGILEDKVNKRISYFLDGEPIEGMQNVAGWSGENSGIDRIFCQMRDTRNQDYVICFDNISVYSVPEYEVTVEINTDLKLAETVSVTTESGEVKERAVTWDISHIDMSEEGEYSVLGEIANTNYVAVVKVKVVDSIKAEMENLREKISEETATQEECLVLFEKLENASDYAMAESYMEEINRYINSFSENTVSQIPDFSKKLSAKTKTVTINYDRILAGENTRAEIKDSNGNVIDCSVKINAQSINISWEDILDINEEYEIAIYDLYDAFGNSLQPEVIEFTTKMIDVNIENETDYGQGKLLSWRESDEISVSCVIKKDGEEISAENNYRFEEIGSYEIILSANDGVEKESYQINILEAYAPFAENVMVVGNAETGAVLKGEYDYYDKNNDAEKDSIYRWYRDDTLIEGATENTYTLTENDEDSNIYFEVVPKADSEMKSEGSAITLSDSLKGETICFEVIPVSTKMPYEGEAVRSESVTVKAKSTSGGSGGSGGGSGGSGFVYVPENKDKVEIKTETEETTPFEDIKNHWAEKYITELYNEGIVEGLTETRFEPNRNIKRAEFIALILRALDEKPVEYEGEFSDVTIDFWASGYIQAALINGIISEDENFRPNDFIKREEAAKIISLVSGFLTVDENIAAEDFADFEDISAWAREYVKDASAKGLIVGDENQRFNPKSCMTRAQAATVIWRMR